MTIFTAEDEQTLTLAKEEWAKYNRELFFAYFEHLAVEAIVQQITEQKNEIMARFKAGNNQYELLRFFTYGTTNQSLSLYRRMLQEDEKTSSPPGCYFHCLNRTHITDLRAIYVHSQFRERLQEKLGTNMLTIHIYSNKDSDVMGITRYENRLVIKCT